MLKESLSNTVRLLQHKLKARKEKGVNTMYIHKYHRIHNIVDDNEWKQKLLKEKKQTRHLEKSIEKLRAELKDVDRAGKIKQHSTKSKSSSISPSCINDVIDSC